MPKAADFNGVQYFLPDRSLRIAKNAVLSKEFQDFPSAFHISTTVVNSPLQETPFCRGHPFISEWELSSTQVVDSRINSMLINNNTLFLFNIELFSIEIRSLTFSNPSQKTSTIGFIGSEIKNSAGDQNVFLLIHEPSSTFLIISKDMLLQYKWNSYDDALQANDPEKKYPPITSANNVSGYQKINSIVYAHIYNDLLCVSAAGQGLYVYSLAKVLQSNETLASVDLLMNYDSKLLNLTTGASLLVSDTAYDLHYQLLYIVDKLNGVFIFDVSNQTNPLLIEKLELIGGTDIEMRQGAVCIMVEEGRNRYLVEYFREYQSGKVNKHYLNRRAALDPGGGALWSDEKYAYLLIEGFSYMYRLGVPDSDVLNSSASTDDYFNFFISIPFEDLTTLVSGNQTWAITVGHGALIVYGVEDSSAEISCDTTNISSGSWTFEFKAYVTDCVNESDTGNGAHRPNSTVCLYNQKLTVLVSDMTSEEDRRLGEFVGLGIGLLVAFLLFIVMCYVLRRSRTKADLLEAQINKFAKLPELEEHNKTQESTEKKEGSGGKQGKFDLEKAGSKTAGNKNQAEVEINAAGLKNVEKQKEAEVSLEHEPDVDDIYNTEEESKGV